MEITIELVKELRDRSGAGIADCKKALAETKCDIEAAVDYLRKHGEKIAAKKADRSASEGIVDSYIHMGGKVGVLVEVNCETDFVARNDDFKEFVHEIALHIAAAAPQYVSREEVPEGEIEREMSVYREQLASEGKPEDMIEKIIVGKMDKYYADVCLMEQAFIKDDSKTINELITEATAKIGERIIIGRFNRYTLGS